MIELTQLVDEAGGTEKFLEAVEEAGGLEKYLDNLHPIGENAKPHLIDTEGIGKNGISGGHNQTNFLEYVNHRKVKIVSEKSHPTVPGITEIEYQLPKLDWAGNVVEPIEYKARPYKKTVYNPSMISDDVMYQWGQEVMKKSILQEDGRTLIGYSENGVKFKGFLNEENEVKNFYPIIEEK